VRLVTIGNWLLLLLLLARDPAASSKNPATRKTAFS
jgi:hypothetical protein